MKSEIPGAERCEGEVPVERVVEEVMNASKGIPLTQNHEGVDPASGKHCALAWV